jgi:hypothetical protein
MNTLKITKYILLICLTVLFLQVCPLFAEEDGKETIDPIQAAESEVLARLNLARSDPWAEAERLGLDPEVLRAEVVPEEVAAQWDQGLWPLVYNDILHEVAKAHCKDMIEQDYFSSETPEGHGAEELVSAAGYPVQLLRENLAALSFEIFLDSQEASEALIDALLVDALMQRFQDGEPALLHEGVVEVGIALWGGEGKALAASLSRIADAARRLIDDVKGVGPRAGGAATCRTGLGTATSVPALATGHSAVTASCRLPATIPQE